MTRRVSVAAQLQAMCETGSVRLGCSRPVRRTAIAEFDLSIAAVIITA